MTFNRNVVRPLLFQLNPERAHSITVEACRLAGRVPPLRAAFRRSLEVTDPALRTELGGLVIKNPISLAAGWDKSGHAVRMLGHLGFGFAEIGSISADLSHGNPKPRLFIGGGGIFTAEDAYQKIRLGASAVQIYTAMVYDGPRAVRQINEGLLRLLRRDGYMNVAQAVGSARAAGGASSG